MYVSAFPGHGRAQNVQTRRPTSTEEPLLVGSSRLSLTRMVYSGKKRTSSMQHPTAIPVSEKDHTSLLNFFLVLKEGSSVYA